MNEITYTEQTIEIANNARGRRTSIVAQVANNGLAYHQTYYSAHDIGPDFTVTQVSTGWGLCEEASHFENEEQCKRFIETADKLADWTKSMSELFGNFTSSKAKERWIKKMRADLTQAALQAMSWEVEGITA